jgi:hypothetical protein
MPALQSIPLPSLRPAITPEPVIKTAAITTTGFPRRAAVVTPAPAPVGIDSALSPEIEAAPDSGAIGAPELPKAESLAPQVTDSAGKTTFKRMLRTIGGTPATAGKPAKP